MYVSLTESQKTEVKLIELERELHKSTIVVKYLYTFSVTEQLEGH